MALVSVVIPAYNAERYIGAAIDSVLAQTARDLEIVVVDDGSTDDTMQRLERYGSAIRYVRQENAGVSAARNRGISEANGRYVAFLDADDVWLPQKLERQLQALAMSPGCRGAHTAFRDVDGQLRDLGVVRRSPRAAKLTALLTQGNVIGTPSTVVAERGLLSESGGFDPSLSLCADWDMWIRLCLRAGFAYVDEPLVLYRLHDASMSRDLTLYERDSVHVLDKAFRLPELPAQLEGRRRESYGRLYMVLAGTYFRAGSYGNFARCAVRAVSFDPRQVAYLLAFPARRMLMVPKGE